MMSAEDSARFVRRLRRIAAECQAMSDTLAAQPAQAVQADAELSDREVLILSFAINYRQERGWRLLEAVDLFIKNGRPAAVATAIKEGREAIAELDAARALPAQEINHPDTQGSQHG